MAGTARKPVRAAIGRRKTLPKAGAATGARAKVHSEMLHLRVDTPLKIEAARTLKEIGFTLSDAMRLFLHRVVVEKRMPLTLDVPNAATRAAMAEIDSAKLRRYATAEDLFDDLEKGAKH